MNKALLIMLFLCTASSAAAKEYTVKLLTTGAGGQTMVMEPGYLKIDKGDSVRFIPSDPTHNAESLVIPENAAAFNTPMGKEAVVTFTNEGAYLYKCTPHFALGMAGVIQVGKASNKPQLLKQWQTVKAGVVMNQDRISKQLSKIKS